MNDSRDDIIGDVLVDSDLARQLVPNKFKFTSKQGRVRRQKLLMGAKKLTETNSISDISLADVCEEAGIPRASAYHFFPNVEAIFLALRFLNAIEMLEELSTIDVSKYNRWQGYITGVMEQLVSFFSEDETRAKLVYETNAPDFEDDAYGEQIDGQVVKFIYEQMSARYEMPGYDNIRQIFLVNFSIVNGVFTLSFRKNGLITETMLREAITASIAYLRCYLPENLPLKKVPDADKVAESKDEA